jgi:WD40 repeat protein
MNFFCKQKKNFVKLNINCFQAWNKSCTEVFTASSDGFVGHFNVKKSLFIGKFRCEEGTKSDPVHSVCVHPSDRSILTGSVARVTWWDLDTKSPFKTFSGAHLGPVTLLSMVTVAEVCYLATGGSSEQDHTLSVWNLTLDKAAGKSDESVVARLIFCYLFVVLFRTWFLIWYVKEKIF